jgi:SSS family transporter
METGRLVFGPGALAAIGLYLLSMIGVGWVARQKRQGDSMADFYLAGRSLGLGVLFLTLYATQYSGNTLFGYTGRTYLVGFDWTASVLFMFSVIVGYLFFAPRLVVLARREGFITPGDYLSYRFQSPLLTLLSTLLMVYALGNYTLAQLKAMGAAVEGFTEGAVPSAYGIVALAIIMVVYETLGGMRSVAWTDVMQGVVLMIGFAILVVVIPGKLGGGLSNVVAKVGQMDPAKVQAPSLEGCATWISYVLLLGCGAAVYPQAIQRLYASRSLRVLKRSLALMAFMPLTTTLVALICGLTGAVVVPGLGRAESDQVLARLCTLVMQDSLLGYWLVVVVFAAILAALMSTADSALLSISSMIARDMYQPFRPRASEAELTLIGKISSWAIIAALVLIAIVTEKTLVRLLELKFEVLVQVVPCFFLGLYWKPLSAATVLAGLLAGLGVALALTWTDHPQVWGFHAGVVGLFANVAVCAAGTLWAVVSRKERVHA